MIRGPFDCVWVGSSSSSPEYFGLGNALDIDTRLDVRDMLGGVRKGMWMVKCQSSKSLRLAKGSQAGKLRLAELSKAA